MTSLFDPISAGALHLPNRIAMAPLTRNRAPGALPNALMATYYAQRASAGLIISEGTAISHQAQGYAQVPGLYSEEQLQGWKQVTKAVQAQGGRIVTSEDGATNLKNIWAGGDCRAGGRDLTVEAVEHGKRAAESIHKGLNHG